MSPCSLFLAWGSTDQWLPALMCCLICFKIRAVQRVYPSEDKLDATDLSSRTKKCAFSPAFLPVLLCLLSFFITSEAVFQVPAHRFQNV